MAAKMTTQSTSCTNCAFYDDHVGNTASQPGDDAGLCRFNPPVSQPSPDAHGLWPVVSSGNWCGHFSPERAGRRGVMAMRTGPAREGGLRSPFRGTTHRKGGDHIRPPWAARRFYPRCTPSGPWLRSHISP